MPGRARPADVAFAAAACIVLAGYNNFVGLRPWHRRWYPAVNALATAVLLAAATASGLTADDLGLRRDRLRSGLRLGAAAAAPVVAAFVLAALTPATRPLLDDQRIAGLDRRQLAYQVLLRRRSGAEVFVPKYGYVRFRLSRLHLVCRDGLGYW